MFTIRHFRSSGDEVFTGKSVQKLNLMPAYPDTVEVETEQGRRILSDGEVFVMNENGATVAKYQLCYGKVPMVPEPAEA